MNYFYSRRARIGNLVFRPDRLRVRLILQPDFVTWRLSGVDAKRPPLDDHGL
jgi:hypothetical protein